MHVYSSKLDWQDYEAIAAELDMKLVDANWIGESSRGKFAGKTHVKFCLRPLTDRFRSARHGRRIWAVSWAGHYVFLRALFERDPEAVVKSAVATYDGRDGFLDTAPPTAHRNVGSMMNPQEYRDAQAPDHAEWGSLDDLDALACA